MFSQTDIKLNSPNPKRLKLMRDTLKVLGLDHLPSTDRDRLFAYYLVDEFGNSEESGIIALSQLPKFIKEKKINIIAIDNIYELYPNPNEIIEFMKKTKIRLIQTTGGFRNQVKLPYLAKKYGIKNTNKLSPQDAAEVSAKLALLGVGSEVNIYEDITKVVVSRSRVLGEGGQHQAKYARSIASLILQEKRKIEEKLKNLKLPYDVYVREGDKGLKGAKFLIYAPYNIVRKHIKDYKGDLYQVKVMPLTKEKIAFSSTIPREKPNRMLICGVDPGDHTGLAIMDLRGRIILVESKKEWSLFDVLNRIYEFGNPIIIATDVPKTPQTVERIAKKTNSIIYKPSRAISISEKHELIRQLGINVKTPHERDALVAAYFAYRKYKNLFDKIDTITSYIPLKINSDVVKRDVINGLSIRDAIAKQVNMELNRIIDNIRLADVKQNDNDAEIKRLKEERSMLLRKLSDSYEKIRYLETKYHELERKYQLLAKRFEESQDKIIILKNKIKNYETQLKKLQQNSDNPLVFEDYQKQILQYREIITQKNKEINKLLRELEKYKILALRKPTNIPVKTLKRLTLGDIEYLDMNVGLAPGDIVYIVDPSGSGKKAAKKIIEKGVIGVIVGENELPTPAREEFEKAGIPIIEYNRVRDRLFKIDDIDEIHFINRKILQKIVEEYKRAKEKTKSSTIEDDVEKIISLYREKRRNVLKH